MFQIRNVLTALVLVAHAACGANLVRKNAFWDSAATHGDINFSDGLVDSTPRVSPSLVRHAKEVQSVFSEILADGAIKISDGLVHEPPNLSDSVMRKLEDAENKLSGSVAVVDESNISEVPIESTPKISPAMMRGAEEIESPLSGFKADADSKVSDVDSTPKISLVRHAKDLEDTYSGSVAVNGEIKMSNGLADSTPKVSQSVVRSAEEAQRTFSGSVAADGFVKISGDLANSTSKISPSVVRSAYHQGDTGGSINISADDGYEAQSSARDLKPHQHLPRGVFQKQNFNTEHGEESRNLTTVVVSPSVQMRSMSMRSSFIRFGFPTDLFTSSRFTAFSILHVYVTSYLGILVLLIILVILALLLSIALIPTNTRRSDASEETALDTMQRVGSEVMVQVRSIIGAPGDGADADAAKDDGEKHDWASCLWKLNSKVAVEERPMWDNWRMRYFLLKEDITVVDESEVAGIYVEVISEKGNMERVRYWATEKKPAILSKLEPVVMQTVSSNEAHNVITRANQYEFAIGFTRRQLSTELPRTLYPLSITFQETDTNLTVASSQRLEIHELARRLQQYSKPCEDGLFTSSSSELNE